MKKAKLLDSVRIIQHTSISADPGSKLDVFKTTFTWTHYFKGGFLKRFSLFPRPPIKHTTQMPLLVHQATALSDCISTAVANTEIGYIEQHISSSNIALAAGKDDSQAHMS